MKKILVLLADGFEEIEAITVIDVLRRANVEVDICSLEDSLVRGTHNILIKSDICIDESLSEYDGVFLPGGMPGAKNLMEHAKVQALIKDYYMKGKLVSAICAAPIALHKAGILAGEKVTSFPSVEKELTDCTYLEDPVVVSNNLLTSRGPATALNASFTILEYLGLSKEASALKEDMLFNFLKENIHKI